MAFSFGPILVCAASRCNLAAGCRIAPACGAGYTVTRGGNPPVSRSFESKWCGARAPVVDGGLAYCAERPAKEGGMSRLFAVVINDPQRLACALYPTREALVARSAPEGWGLACYQGGEVLLQRHPKPRPAPLDFFQQVKDLRTDYVVGHVMDPGTVSKLENTQPFRFRSWVYAQSGGVELAEARAAIL